MQGPHRGGRVDHRSGASHRSPSLLQPAPTASAQTGFRGYKGKAVLYASTLNTVLAAPSILLMDTGAHTIQEAACAPCGTYLGWKIVRAHEASEKWKEGRFLLELALLEEAAVDEADSPTPVRLHPATPVSEPSTPVHEAPASATLRPLPLPNGLRDGSHTERAGARTSRRH
ncbi:uncharacterized protein C8Q71DRAFT_717313 [Rhodofomes roseus]|uniref:Yippee domain-containing protein n=1 Tax=Rhodofomes roseus TaxID=34475 RepID=A0ABQ8K0G8_9APHY|nr:uncharacterized protein C8Q71DRAFT_717313 [Rhodofomes roseus]KAH9830126.1 hypothetical protein C8Q71DRAFT_717313 [Rhodofomes roseus]